MSFFRFDKKYFLLTVLLFITEVLIALFLHDNFIRPYVGDYLVVILIYCFCMSFVSAPVCKMALATLLFSYLIETLQYYNFVNILGLKDSKIANIIMGNAFAWGDIFAYTLGTLTVVVIEYLLLARRRS